MQQAVPTLSPDSPGAGRSILFGDMRALLALAAPIIGITLSRMLMGFADFFQVSYLGTAATAAISPATMFVFTGLCLGMGAVTSVQTYTSQSVGRGKPREAGAYAWQAMYVAVASLVLAYPMVRYADRFWDLINPDAPADVRALQLAYCRVALWSIPLGIACSGLEAFFNGIHKSGVALRAIIAALAVNVVGNYLLIFGKFGLPQMGIQGAAIATVIGWVVRIGVLMLVFLSKEFREQYNTGASWRLNYDKLKAIVTLGGPTAVQWLLDVGAWLLFQARIIQNFGTATLAASNTCIQYMHVAFMPAIGLGIALCSVVGQSIGEGKPDLAMRKTKAALLMAVCYMGMIGVIFMAIPRPLMSMVSGDQTVIDVGTGVLMWAALFQISDAFCIIYINALRGAGDTRWPAVVLVLLCWILFIGGGTSMARFFPEWRHHGPWLTCTLYITVLGTILWWRFTGGAWRKINLFKSEEVVVIADKPVYLEPEAVALQAVENAETAADAGLPI